MNSDGNNDHDYIGSRLRMGRIISSENSNDFDPRPVALRRRRQARRLTPTQRAENTDHDYLARPRDAAADGEEAEPDALEEGDAEEEEEQAAQQQAPNEAHNIADALAVAEPNDDQEIEVLERANSPLEAVAPDENNASAALGHLPPDSLQASTSAAGANQVYDLTSPAPLKKRKRHETGTPKSHTPKVKSTSDPNDDAGDDEDDGLTCPICLDSWEMSGEHRLVSLRCGHLFGDACIRRWLSESARQSGIKACPQCKTKATNRDIRCLYAKRLRAIDRSEEHRLREQLDKERQRSTCLQTELATMKMTYTMVTNKIQTLEADNDRMRQLLRGGGAAGGYGCEADPKVLAGQESYRLSLERNIEVSREPGCRVLLHAQLHSTLLASQKSAQGLFPGYGVRFIDVPSFRTSNFMHTSIKLMRDMCLSSDQQLLAVASMETRTKLFDLRTRQVAAVISPGEKLLWSCAMDRNERSNFLYLGASNGSTYVYDIRFPEAMVDEFKTEGDLSPVINVAAVGVFKNFPNGGIIVCKLQSLWFHEYSTASGSVTSTRFNIEGPFTSMHFDGETVLVSTRNNARYPQSRYILGRLDKIDETPIFLVRSTFYGSKATPVMTRSRQIAVERNTLIAGYVQDTKLLTLYDVRRELSAISMPVQDVVYDTCPLYLPNTTYLAALTETKCRIYKLSPLTFIAN